MKTYINSFIFLILLIPFTYAQFPSESSDITNVSDGYVGHEDALINDVVKLEFDVKNSKVSFDFVSEDTSGTIGGLDFKISFNPEDPDNAYFKGTALVNTLDTDNFLRDGHLMWEKFFYKKKYPKISFVSSQVVHFGNNNYKVIGDLTIKGVTKEVIINFTLDITTKLAGKTTIYTSDYGVNIHDEREKNKLNIVFDFPILK
ncbi:YceI family protein [Aquimarina sp. 2201CG14-23]|uniref:YceI family protein n=1 Tax=Aquimarina mycalae TaxID=3040073 RepID=UPI002477EE0D|nr:YceI family protein [Aquimarina sp. 2201CG14-23]MDH7446442.1 YceI family protein [Aquimarina sp. 2201CG14-23]